MEPIDKDPSFIVRSESPVCGGPPLARLVERALTWREDFFVRNHGAIPDVALDGWRMSVEGLVNRPASYTLAELTSRFSRREAVATLQCAGNRRDELISVRPIPGEVPWGAEDGDDEMRFRIGPRLPSVADGSGVDAAGPGLPF